MHIIIYFNVHYFSILCTLSFTLMYIIGSFYVY